MNSLIIYIYIFFLGCMKGKADKAMWNKLIIVVFLTAIASGLTNLTRCNVRRSIIPDT